jgi:hypothetical protein
MVSIDPQNKARQAERIDQDEGRPHAVNDNKAGKFHRPLTSKSSSRKNMFYLRHLWNRNGFGSRSPLLRLLARVLVVASMRN